MSAGYIQLVALGQQDAYLTGEPQVTYFSGVYKRHTPFVLEAYDIPFNEQTITYGQTSICRIPPKGDLIRGLTLKMILPALYNPGNDWVWPETPSTGNYPALWFGWANGYISSQITGSSLGQFYSTNATVINDWFGDFTPPAVYNSSLNQFLFNNVANVIVQSGFDPTNAGSGVFWGFDPVNYDTIDQYGNLVYNSTISPLANLTANSSGNSQANTYISVVTPDFTLEQAGWTPTVGAPQNSQTSFYASIAQPLQITTPSSTFISFSALTPTLQPYWSLNDVDSSNYLVSAAGLLQIIKTGYYTLTAAFNLSSGAVVSISYGASSTGGIPLTPTFLGTYTYTVSPNPTSPAIIPINVTAGSKFYYFYIQTNTECNILDGSYFVVTPANETYKITSNIALSTTTNAEVPLYGNVAAVSAQLCTLYNDSTFKFNVNGEYLVSGVLSLSNPTTESYVSSVRIGDGSNIWYTYDMSAQGRNPTYAFSIPLVANTQFYYYINVSSTSSLSNIMPGSFFNISQIGVQQDTTPGTILPYNGVLLQSTSSTLTTPLDLYSKFSSNTNSTSIVKINTNNEVTFANVMSYMMTGVFYTSSPVTSVSINGVESFNFSLGTSSSPPYTISVPFRITNNTSPYTISLTTYQSGATVNNGTYIAIYPIASTEFPSGSVGGTYNYYDSVGTIAVVSADLKIGGQTIQRLTGEYIEVWNELNIPYENQPGLQLLTGKYDTQTSIPPPGRTYYVNLPYYFYDRPELSLPIVALDRQDVEVWVTFNNFSNLTSVSVTNPTLQATIITEYAYLSNPEINWFQNHRLDYVITQCQYESYPLAQNFRSAIFDLKFKNPIKELFFLLHPDSNLPYNYTTPGGGTDAVSFGMTFNGEDAFLTVTTNTLYVGAIEPFARHINFFSQPSQLTTQQPNQYGRQFYMYSFSLDPFGTVSSGQINFSRIRQVLLEMNILNSLSNYPSKTFNIIAISQNVMRIENGLGGIMFH